jgi:hypothetical protein
MNTNPYSYDECLAVLELCSGLERHTISQPEAHHIRTLGIGMTKKILEMNHAERISFIKEVVQFL